MKHDSDNRQVITDYLLGLLPQEELERFEERYLEDETLFEELQEIEDELIDDYVGGALTAQQRAQFEEHFLRSAERQKKVEFARAITGHAVEWKKERERGAPSSTPAQSSLAESDETVKSAGKTLPFKRWSRPVPAWGQWGAIAAAVLLAVGGGAVWLRNQELRRELIAAGSNEERLRQEVAARSANEDRLQSKVSDQERENRELLEKLARVPRSLVEGAGNAVFSTFLSLGKMMLPGTRGGDEPKITTLNIPANTLTVHLDVGVDNSKYTTFQATLERRDGKIPELSLGSLRPGKRRSIGLDIPASKLTPGDYVLSLRGVTPEGNQEPVGKYYLKAVKRWGFPAADPK